MPPRSLATLSLLGLLAAGASAQTWVDLGDGLDPRLHLTLGGTAPGSTFGASLAAVPDADGDGFSEVAVAAPELGGGQVRLHSSSNGLQLWSRSASGHFGSALAGLGDVDGDLRGEVAASAPGEGRVLLLSGLDGHPLWQHPGDPLLRTGASLARLDDLSGDTRDELVVGQPGDGLTPCGPVLVLSGVDGQPVRSLAPPPGDALFGAAVAGAGDIDGDGAEDILVGAPGVDGGALAIPGPKARVFSGATGLLLLTLLPPSGLPDSSFGAAVASAGDVDGDGRADLLVGAPADAQLPGGPRLGSLTLYDGASGAALRTWWGSADGCRFGQSLAGGFDPDGDGALDALVGAPGMQLPGKPGAGSVSLLRAHDGQLLTHFDGDAGDGLGAAVAFLGDGGGGRLPGVLLGKPLAADAGQVALMNDLSHPAGAPTLSGSGSQLAGEPFEVSLQHALPFATVALVIGLGELHAPFKGGTLVPLPDLLIFLASDGAGALVLPSVWPAGFPASAAPLFLQFWCQDGLAPVGWSASNGLVTIVP